MDELESLRAVLAREPSQTVVDEGRHRLVNAIRHPAPGPGRRRRPGVGLALVAASAACSALVAVGVVATGDPAPTASPAPTGTTSRTGPSAPTRAALSGKEVLLAAATTAEQSPESSGRYWYQALQSTWMMPGVTEPPPLNPEKTYLDEYWNDRDGNLWYARNGKKPKHLPAKKGFYTIFHYFTFEELQNLPADPAALRDLTRKYYEEESAKDGDHTRLVSMDAIIAGSLVELLYEVPAPPKVRAAAFRAIAELPEVEYIGAVDGGIAVRYPVGPDKETVVVDPGTSLLRSVLRTGRKRPGRYLRIVAAKWTDELRTTPRTADPATGPTASTD